MRQINTDKIDFSIFSSLEFSQKLCAPLPLRVRLGEWFNSFFATDLPDGKDWLHRLAQLKCIFTFSSYFLLLAFSQKFFAPLHLRVRLGEWFNSFFATDLPDGKDWLHRLAQLKCIFTFSSYFLLLAFSQKFFAPLHLRVRLGEWFNSFFCHSIQSLTKMEFSFIFLLFFFFSF